MERTIDIDPAGPVYELTVPIEQTFKVLIACESPEASILARKVQQRVEDLCGNECAVSCAFWHFASFRNKELRERAAKDADQANMIIISLRGGKGLPDHVVSWVERWRIRFQNDRAALVVLPGSGSARDGVLPPEVGYLRQMAVICGLDFFCKLHDGEHVNFPQPSFLHPEWNAPNPHNALSYHKSWDKGSPNLNN